MSNALADIAAVFNHMTVRGPPRLVGAAYPCVRAEHPQSCAGSRLNVTGPTMQIEASAVCPNAAPQPPTRYPRLPACPFSPQGRLGIRPEDVVLYGQSVGSGPTVRGGEAGRKPATALRMLGGSKAL